MNKLKRKEVFLLGVKRLLPITAGVIPFGLIMGAVATNSGLSVFETMTLNFAVFAGAAQLAAIELMSKDTPAFIIVLTGIVINLRFIMYSTSLAPVMAKVDPLKRMGLGYFITDQSYAVSVNEFDKLESNEERVIFYLGASSIMAAVWQVSTLGGALFGNINLESLSLDFAVPLAFMTLVIPTLKNKIFVMVAFVSFVISIMTKTLPYNLGLLVSAFSAIGIGVFLEKRLGK